jgi:GYF domain 2
VTGLEPIWHVIIGGRQQGPLTEDQVLAYLGDGTLAAGDFVWCPDFPDWKRASEIGDNRPLENLLAQAVVAPGDAAHDDQNIAVGGDVKPEPVPFRWNRIGALTAFFAAFFAAFSLRGPSSASPENALTDEPRPIEALAAGAAWSLWTSANVGMLISALALLLQIGRGQGFELANYAHTASPAAISALIGQILSVPLLFVLIALVRNLLKQGRPKPRANPIRHALAFSALLLCMLGGLGAYGQTVFASTEIISGEARKSFIADAYGACLRKQHADGQNVSDPQVDKYCICISQKMAASTTYQQVGSEPDANALAELKQKVEAVSDACR